MIHRPKFKDHLRPQIVAPDRLILLSESGHTEVVGRIFTLLASLMDGRRTFPEISERIHSEASLLDVVYGLTWFEEHGHIVEGTDEIATPLSAFRDSIGLNAEEFSRRLRDTTVRVVSVGGTTTVDLTARLTSLGIRVNDDGYLWVLLTDDYLQPDLIKLSAEAERLKRTSMLLKPVGTVLWFGPVFASGKSPCFECLSRRLREKRSRFLEDSDVLADPVRPLPHLPSTVETALSIAATQILVSIASNERTPLEDRILTLDTLSMQTASHAVRRHPRCLRCGCTEAPGARPLLLHSRRKTFTSEGGHRVVAPETTLRTLLPLVSPITGIIDKLESRRSDPNGIHEVFVTDWPAGRLGSSAFQFALRSKCVGKGVTPAQAQVSALCEALERYSGIFQDNEIRITSTFRALGAAAIHPNACMNFSENQYASRLIWNASNPPALRIPEKFDEDAELEWTPVWSLTQGEVKYLPTAYCYFGYPNRSGRVFCGADSNGNAAGNTLEEAILQGFMELVERDCVSMWWYNRSPRPGVDLNTFDQPYFSSLRAYYRSLGRHLWVLDLTNDLGIPTFVAISLPVTGHGTEMMGFGAHFSAELAILRALTELNQFLPSGADENAVSAGDAVWLTPLADSPPRTRADFRDASSEDLHLDVLRCVAIAKERGLETLVLDQTRPETGLNVVKVVVPGLRSWWARFGRGRLYDIPVLLGWREGPTPEAELNPRHIHI